MNDAHNCDSDIRCTTCREAGTECPQGYYAGAVECSICNHKIVLLRAQCIDEWPNCPRCETGTLFPPDNDLEDDETDEEKDNHE